MLTLLKKILTKKQKKRFLLLSILAVIQAVVELIGVSAILPVVNLAIDPSIIETNSIYNKIYYCLGFSSVSEFAISAMFFLIFVYVFKNLYILVAYYLQYKFTFTSQQETASEVMNKYVARPYLFHVSTNVADLQRNVTTDVAQMYQLILNVIQMFVELVTSVLLVIFLLLVDVKTTLAIIGILGITIIIFYYLFNKIQGILGSKGRIISGRLNKSILQTFGGIKEIKITGRESYFLNEFTDTYKEYAKIQRKNSFRGVYPRPMMEIIVVCGLLGVMSFKMIQGGNLTSFIPLLSVFAATAVRMLPAVNRITNCISTILYVKPSLTNLNKDLEEAKKYSEDCIVGECKINFTDKIGANNVFFSYNNDSNNVLEDVNLTVPKNKSVAFIGESGGGKTTLADIVLGILKPSSGTIEVDGVNIHENINSWKPLIGYIPQSIYLMDDTIRKNIAFGISDELIDDDEIWNVLRMAQLDEFVKNSEDGLDTIVGDKGVKLSGGQRQRIGIARALYSKPTFLVLDEATSALDNDTEQAVMDAVKQLKGKVTLLIIAHRLSTIQDCDIVYKIENKSATLVR